MSLEALLEFIFEIIGEILVQFILEIGMELGFESVKEAVKVKKEPNPVLSIIGLLILGSIVGLISGFVFQERIISKTRISGMGIIVSPLVTGCLLQLFGNWRRKQGKYTSYLATFWGGAAFAFGLIYIRWLVVGRFF